MAKSVAQWREEVHELEKQIIRLEVSLEKNQERMVDLEKRCGELQEQILRLQDALVAREAPDAYADRKEDEALPDPTPDELDKIKKNQELAKVNREVLDRITDDHYFDDADHMMELLTQGAVPEFERRHQNNES